MQILAPPNNKYRSNTQPARKTSKLVSFLVNMYESIVSYNHEEEIHQEVVLLLKDFGYSTRAASIHKSPVVGVVVVAVALCVPVYNIVVTF